jgi:hypothetical protein
MGTDTYIVEHIRNQISGEATPGLIKDVRVNPTTTVPGNYLARVAYTVPPGKTFETDFRYGEAQLQSSPNATVIYSKDDPNIAFIQEDGSYFRNSILGLCFFILLYAFWFTLLAIPDVARLINKMKKKRSA